MPTPDQAGDAIRQVIRAYHGSPYDFDRFYASKIGTGEGAQSYGHGLYFAGKEDTADYYRKALSASMRTPDEDALEIWRRHAEASGNKEKAVLYALEEADDALNEARRSGMQLATERWGDILQGLYNIDHRQPLPKRPGHMYEVEIGHPEDALIDWDATLDEQQHLLPAAERAIGRIQDPRARYDAMGIIEEPAGNKGRDLYGILKAYAPESGRVGDSARFASRALLEQGVPGIRYLDEGSRRAGQGTRNYVMFPGTEDQIRILRKYGLMAPIAAGSAASGASEPPAQ